MHASPKLHVERIEDRIVPAVFGTAWIDTHLTVSFAPDGTDVAGVPSTLFQTLGGRATTAEWQGAITAAFQTWVAPTNLNFAIVADDGRPVGSPGPVQGSPHVGDIRVTSRPLSDDVLAVSNPFDLVSPWAGEIILNSNKVFDTDGSADANGLYTVMLHEIGHALGLPGSQDPQSVMNEYRGHISALSAQDVAAVQGLYGVRQPDRFDIHSANDTLMTSSGVGYVTSASDLLGPDGSQGNMPFIAEGDITAPGDVDIYYVTPPKFQNRPTVVVQTDHLSSVRLQVSVIYRPVGSGVSGGEVLASTSTPDARGNYVLPFPQSPGWYTYYVKIEAAADAGRFTVGSYRLAMGDGLTAIPRDEFTTAVRTPGGTVQESADWSAGRPANDTLSTATRLGNAGTGADARWDYAGRGAFGAAGDVDVYQVRSGSRSGDTMVVSVNTPRGGVDPTITVYDAKGRPVAAEVLLRNGDSICVQVCGAKPNETYYVAVRSVGAATWAGTEAYQFGIDFRTSPIVLTRFASGTLSAEQPQLSRTLDVTSSQGSLFQLTASGGAGTARLTVYDGGGRVVYSLSALSGQTVIGDTLLAPDRYTVVLDGVNADGTPATGLYVDARHLGTTEPIGLAAPCDPTTTPDATRIAPTFGDATIAWIVYDPSYYAWLM